MRVNVTRHPYLVLSLVVGVFALAIRWYGLGGILTADERQWVFRSQRFVHSLTNGDIGGTFQGTHPGVVPMYLIGAGLQLRSWWTGERLESPRVGAFRWAAKFPIAVGVSVGIGLVAGLIARLWGRLSGLAAGVLLGVEPYLVGMSQIAHLDALLAVLVLAALLALLLFRRTGEGRHLVLSAVLGGLAILTKLPAFLLLPFVPLVLLTSGRTLRQITRASLVWVLGGVLTIGILWPSMWTHLLPNLRYAIRDTRTVTEVTHGGEQTDGGVPSKLFYLRALLTRTSPVTLFLAVAGGVLLVRTRGERRWEALMLVLFAVGFLLMLSLVAKRADRYLLPIITIADILAAVSGAALIMHSRRGRLAAMVIAILLLSQTLLLSPYAVSAGNQLVPWEDPTQSGWGEGLERVATVLNDHPLADRLQVASWYSTVLSEFFHGQTMTLSSRNDARVDYVVLYRNMWGRGPEDPATQILREYQSRVPVRVVTVAGRDLAWIYAQDSVDRFPAHVGELVGSLVGTTDSARVVEVGQEVRAEAEPLSGVRLIFSTFSSRPRNAHAVVHVREEPDGDDLRTVTIDTSTLEDRAWKEIRFAPIEHSRGRTYYIAVTSPDGRQGNAVTLQYQPKDFLPGQLILVRRPLRPGEQRRQFARAGDLAYELRYDRSSPPPP